MYSHSISRLLIVSSPLLLLQGLLTGCSDDNPAVNSYPDGAVCFNARIGNGWNEGYASRGEEIKRKLNTLTLRGGDNPLYLVPKEIDGINNGINCNTHTRSSLTDAEGIQDFGVFASMKPDGATSLDGLVANYMNNVEVTRENNWQPEQRYLWPGTGALHFNAYSPFISTPGNEGVTSLPSTSASGELHLDYTTPSDVENQIDLMVSTPVDSKSSPCNLTFNHMLTAIRFATGSEMAPCTIKEIALRDVAAAGTLNMETGEWSGLSSLSTFSVSADVILEATEGSKFVAPDTYITDADHTLLLIPQTLPETAAIVITFDSDGKETTLEASLDGTVWQPGKTIIYRLSANPNSDSFIFEITDEEGNPISSLTSNYTGSTLNFKIKSVYGDDDDSSSQKEVAWKAEFVDNQGNVIDLPEWITDWTMTGDGSTSLTSVTEMQTPVFEAISAESSKLREAADINTTSGYQPYNLANPTGQASVQSTANCYLIHAPGFYSIPLVYGNAIMNGQKNTSAYQTTTSSNTHILKNMVNHLGVAITDPYIYNNANCSPEDAVLVWEGRLNLIQNVKLSPDKTRLIFTVSPDFICQGNAIVAVRDASGTIMWSWHLWVTPYEPDSDAVTIAYHGKNYELMTRNLGQITSGDRANFSERQVVVRYTQIPDDGSDPLSISLTVTQTGKIVVTPDSYNYYQWGRKDPMISDIGEWYTSDFNEITALWTKNYANDATPGIPIIADYIRSPGYFWVSGHNDEVFPYYNLWNTNNSTTDEVKTVYDPSPIGYMVARNVLTALNNATLTPVDGNMGIGVNLTVPATGETIFFPTHGYRSSTSGALEGTNAGGEIGTVWTSRTSSTTNAGALILTTAQSVSRLQLSEPRPMGFGVRSSKEL